jgi:hypothetical protein
MFALCVFTRVLQMSNLTFTVLNADISVIYMGVSVHIYVHCVIRYSVKRAVLQDINAHIVVSALMFVKYVIRHSVTRAI